VRTSILLALAAGALAGALVPLAPPAGPAPAPWSRDRPRATPGRAPSAGDCTSRAAEHDRELDEAFDALEAAEAELWALQDEVEALIGPRRDFTGVDERFGPDRVEDEVLRAIEDQPLSLEWIDCSEAPCVAILRLTEPLGDNSPSPIGDAVRAELGTGYPWEAFGTGGAWYLTVPLGAEVDDLQLHQRVDLREEFIIHELAGWAPP
jgi:hypothetical protein